MRMRLCLALMLMLTVMKPTISLAQSGTDAAAHRAFARGQELLAAGQHEEALSSYQEAMRLAPESAAPLLGMGLCLIGLERQAEALEMLDRYLDRGRNAESRRQAEEAIAPLLQALGIGTIRVEVDPSDARVTVDGDEVPAPRLERIRVVAGEHSVAAQADGYSEASQQVTVEASDEAAVSLALSPAAALPPDEPGGDVEPTPTPTPRTGRGVLWPLGWASLGVGLALIGTGGLFLGLDGNCADEAVIVDFERQCDLYETATAGWALMGTGLGVAIVGAVLLIVDALRGRPDGGPLSMRPTGRGGVAIFRF